jgi:hypothetical protein
VPGCGDNWQLDVTRYQLFLTTAFPNRSGQAPTSLKTRSKLLYSIKEFVFIIGQSQFTTQIILLL